MPRPDAIELQPDRPASNAPGGWSASDAVAQARRDYRRAMGSWAACCLRLRALGLDRPAWSANLQSGASR